MPPGLLSSELTVTFPSAHQQSAMEDSMFPPIARKSAISLGSELDPSDYCNQSSGRNTTTRGSVPASLSSSPVKFPTIDRANSTSVASLPGSRATRHRSNMRELRSSYCRSPSCPSHLDVSREFNQSVDFQMYMKEKEYKSDSSDVGETSSGSKLPSIFSNDLGSRVGEGRTPGRHETPRDRAKTLTLKRSDSLTQAYHTHLESATPLSTGREPLSSSRDNEPRQNQGAALLLPIRTNTQTNKKKKRQQRMPSDSDGETIDSTPRNYPKDFHKPRLPLGREHEDALNAIARENDAFDEDIDTTPRAIEISSSRKVKQWMNNNQKDTGQIKA